MVAPRLVLVLGDQLTPRLSALRRPLPAFYWTSRAAAAGVLARLDAGERI